MVALVVQLNSTWSVPVVHGHERLRAEQTPVLALGVGAVKAPRARSKPSGPLRVARSIVTAGHQIKDQPVNGKACFRAQTFHHGRRFSSLEVRKHAYAAKMHPPGVRSICSEYSNIPLERPNRADLTDCACSSSTDRSMHERLLLVPMYSACVSSERIPPANAKTYGLVQAPSVL